MKYQLLNDADRQRERANRLRQAEAEHYRLSLELEVATATAEAHTDETLKGRAESRALELAAEMQALEQAITALHAQHAPAS